MNTMSGKTYEELVALERIVINQEACIGCGACISSCPNNALELNEEGKAVLIFELCEGGKPGHENECLKACPVQSDCMWRAGEAPEEAKKKTGWYTVKDTSEHVLKALEEWKKKYGIA